ncbi:GNAT family N-acetyltransferase [Planctomicrobium sp. SH664]|uniref:GNAT family N-acetyltransferase n=1 Tax=Planctomicrobium sp. SH664 TaxID=3448125 RepID=UPI003F5BA57F
MFSSTLPPLNVRLRQLAELPAEVVHQWRSLSSSAAEPNVFLDPDFLLPLTRNFPSAETPALLSVEQPDGRMLLATCVEAVSWSTEIPFPHLSGLQSPYSFRGGLLIDRENAAAVLKMLFQQLASTRYRHALKLHVMRLDSELYARISQGAAEHGIDIRTPMIWKRAALDLRSLGAGTVIELCCSKTRRKSLRAARRKMEERGPLAFRLCGTPESLPAATARFLHLEQQGWKQDEGTAIACRPADRKFFEEMITALGERSQVLFGELLCGDQVIASTCNLISGNMLFAFKIGWDQKFADGSPGMWAEFELLEALRTERPDIRFLDSCSRPGSYLEKFWNGTMILGEVNLLQSRRAKVLTRLQSSLRTAKRQIVISIDEADPFALLEPLGLG